MGSQRDLEEIEAGNQCNGPDRREDLSELRSWTRGIFRKCIQLCGLCEELIVGNEQEEVRIMSRLLGCNLGSQYYPLIDTMCRGVRED